MSNISIQLVETKKQFIYFPWKIYKNYPHWVPPLLMDIQKILSPTKNPFFQHADMQLFLAFKNGEIVGRIAAIKNDRYNEVHDKETAFFGFFECVNEQAVANALFEKAAEWVREKGFSKIQGPASPSSNGEFGLLVEGFDDAPRLMMAYNPPYYEQLIENGGFEKVKTLLAYKISYQNVLDNPKIARVANIATTRSRMTLRPINMKDLGGEMRILKSIYNQAWAPNWGFVPFSDAELDDMAQDLKMLVDKDLLLFGEIDGEAVAFAMVVPDFNYIFQQMNGRLFPFKFLKLFTQRKNIKWVRIIVLGILPKYQKKGLDAVFYHQIAQTCMEKGYKYAEASWILDDNEAMKRGAALLNGEVYKRYAVYERNI